MRETETESPCYGALQLEDGHSQQDGLEGGIGLEVSQRFLHFRRTEVTNGQQLRDSVDGVDETDGNPIRGTAFGCSM